MSTTEPPEETLRRWAMHLDKIRNPSATAQPFVDCMSDALVWPDETDSSTPVQVIGALRFVRHYRTGLIIGEQRPHGEYWQLGRELFPNWVGFHPSRCDVSPRLSEIYNVAKQGGSHGSQTKAD
jgi:hypothetical protein